MINLKFVPFSPFLSRSFFFLFIIFNSVSYCYGQNIPVPENIQAALLPKVLKFNSELSEKEKIKMLIVYDNNSLNNKDKFFKELKGVMEIKAIRSIELDETISGYDLIYFMPGLADLAIICKSQKILSVTGISQYVEEGKISLGFGIQNNKPKIFVNLTSLDEEGQSFSSDILRIAKIFN